MSSPVPAPAEGELGSTIGGKAGGCMATGAGDPEPLGSGRRALLFPHTATEVTTSRANAMRPQLLFRLLISIRVVPEAVACSDVTFP